MLLSLEIKNFAIIQRLKMEVGAGLTCITGESGAGKSLLLDGLEIVLAQRRARAGELQPQCELIAVFDIKGLWDAYYWLKERDMLELGDGGGECVVVRRYWRDGKTAYNSINDHACTQNSIKELGELLLQIYGQHQYYQLMDVQQHLKWLDSFADNDNWLQQVHAGYRRWRQLEQQKTALLAQQQNSVSKIEFLDFQLQELSEVEVTIEHIRDLQQRQRAGAHHQQLLQILGSVGQLLEGEDRGLVDQLAKAKSELARWHYEPNPCAEIIDLLDHASIQLDEATQRVNSYLNSDSQIDWTAYQQAETELDRIYRLARKYHIEPEQLAEHRSQLQQERRELEQLQQRLMVLDEKIADSCQQYEAAATQLTERRREGAKQLDIKINQYLHLLGMENAAFVTKIIDLDSGHPEPWGAEKAEFYLTVNAGSPQQPLRLAASGGEISRVNLALQTAIGRKIALPTMIFDEVDSGIGGVAAEAVAKLLYKLGRCAQVICVTHLAQVAVQGDQHYRVSKQQTIDSSCIELRLLSKEERINEIARMLAGSQLTELTMAHATELLASGRR